MINLVTAAGGNLGSVKRFLRRTGTDFKPVSKPEELSCNNPLLIPGVGSFGASIRNLMETGFPEKIEALVRQGIPILGICSGMQILFESSEESPGISGLGLIPGNVVRFTRGKIPNTGWCRLKETGEYVYFVNSYHAVTDWKSTTSVHHGETFTAIAEKGPVTGFQFHPEKSGAVGENCFRRWLNGL